MKIGKIAIIGAGFSGLSAAWHLLDNASVTVFDHKGIGGGASGIAAGLMHPYPGQQGLRSFLATEGLAATKKLLEIAQKKSALALALENGIIRYLHNEEMRSIFLSHAENYGDVERCGSDAFLIRSGMTIFCKPYLEALWQVLAERGVQLRRQKVSDLSELASYDHVVLAAGSGTLEVVPGLKLELLKGQILRCKIPENVDFPAQSVIRKGYIAHAREERLCYIGSTYERGQLSELPDRERAEKELLDKAQQMHPEAHLFPILGCLAAFRVMRIGHYYPLVAKLKENIWIATALGSRGLLYHGIIGEYLSKAILADDPSLLPKEFGMV
jgi:glycine/D-amino acid oxidase-like deaminating enzyme